MITLLSAFIFLLLPGLAACQSAVSPEPLSQPTKPDISASRQILKSDRVAAADRAFNDSRFLEALTLYQQEKQALPKGDELRHARLDYSIGTTQTELRNFASAEASLKASLAFALRDEQTAPMTRFVRQALGETYRAKGDPAAARDEFLLVLKDRQAALDDRGAAYAMADIGTTYVAQASFSKAHAQYKMAEGQLTELKDPARGRVLVNAASVYAWLGDSDGAEQRISQAIELCSGQGDARCVASGYHARSLNLFLKGDFSGSRDAAAAAVLTFGDRLPVERARALNNLGLSELNLGQPAKALDALKPAASLLAAYGDAKDLAAVTDSLGTAYLGTGRLDDARADYVRALTLWRQAGFAEGTRDTLANLGLLLREQKRPEEAILFLKLSVSVAQTLRTDAQSLPEQLQRLLTRRLAPTYQLLIALLVDQGRFAEAHQIYRMLKEQELHEFLRGSEAEDVRTTKVSYTPAEAASRLAYERASSQFNIAPQLEAIRTRERAGTASRADSDRKSQLERQLRQARSDFERFLSATTSLQREAASKRTAVRDLEVLMEPLGTLGPGAVVLQYVVLPDQVRILMTTASEQTGYVVQVKREALYKAVWTFRQSLTSLSRDILASAKTMHDLLMPPELANDLAALSASTVMVSLDGELRYVPLSALYDGQKFLIDKFSVVGYTVDSDVKLLQAPINPWRVSAFGMTQAASGFNALGSVRGEIERIVHDGRGQARFDAQFTRDTLLSAVADEPPVLHIASHFSFAPGSEEDSFLLLGDGSHLSIGDFKQFKFSKMELLTLSACETAVAGGVNQNGREIDGLASVVQRRGSASVLATLWSVDDSSTALLMADFYDAHSRAEKTMSKAAALRAAQLHLAAMKTSEVAPGQMPRRGKVESTATPVFNSERPFAHPFYWAPFLLVGNWR